MSRGFLRSVGVVVAGIAVWELVGRKLMNQLGISNILGG